MESWQEYLINQLADLLESAPHANKWLASLSDAEEAQILGLSLAIDLASSSLAANLLAEALMHLPHASNEACADFVAALESHGDCRLLSQHRNRVKKGESYARVMGLYEFFTYSYRDNSGTSLSAQDVNDLRLELQASGGRPLGDIDNGFSGAGGINWISDTREIESSTGPAGLFFKEAATAIADCLGLPEKRSFAVGMPPELIMVTYPEDVNFEVWKPTTLDGFWMGGFFLSSASTDGWGATQSCSGTAASKRERIHEGLPFLTDGFTGWYIGAMKTISQDRIALRAEANQRWQGVGVA